MSSSNFHAAVYEWLFFTHSNQYTQVSNAGHI